MRRIFTLFLFAILFGGYAMAYDFSAVCESGQTLYYNITSSTSPYTVEVTSQNTSYPYYSTYPTGNITIPSSVTYNDKTYSVTGIGRDAFSVCSGLTSVTIPNSVTSIGSYAFYGCSGITSLTIPESITYIGNGAFSNCNGLTSIIVEQGNSIYDSRDNCNAIIDSEVNTLILGCMNTTIPNSVTSIGESAFGLCSGLTSVAIPNSVTSIGSSAFSACTGLTSVTIPNSVTRIGEFAFQGCSGLTSVTIGNSVTSIGEGAFHICSGLTAVYYTGSIEQWCGITFENSGYIFEANPLCNAHNLYINDNLITDLVIPEGITEINPCAFYGATLASVTIPSSVTSIGTNVFELCSGLTAVYYTGSIEQWCGITFGDITSNPLNCAHNLYIDNTLVVDLNIPESVTELKNYAFSGATCLTSVTIPNTVTSIGGTSEYGSGSCVFSGCSGLVEMTIPFVGGGVGTVGGGFGDEVFGYIFGNSSYEGGMVVSQLCTPNTVVRYRIPSSLRSVTVTGGNLHCGAFSGCSMLTSVTIGDSVTSIGESAFNRCWGLTSVTIGKGVTSIGDHAFTSCGGLTTINFNATNCTTMGSSNHQLFSDCTSLASLNIGENVTNIPDYAFYGCNGLTSLIIPELVTNIGLSAFEDCSSIRTMTLGSNVATIGDSAFANCTGLFMATVKPEYPPMAQTETFANVSTTAIIKVPCGSVPYYNAAQYWNVFTNVQGDMVYALTVGSSDDVMGSVAVTQAPTCTDPTAIITATANSGYRFVQWNDGNTDNPRTITVTGDVTYTASFTSLMGIEETSASEIVLFPNPATDILNITSSETISEIEIVNVMGQVVKRFDVNSDNAVCDVEDLKAGVYMVRIHAASATLSQRRFVKE